MTLALRLHPKMSLNSIPAVLIRELGYRIFDHFSLIIKREGLDGEQIR
ncbi:hypothetical protein Bccel_0044 [Pseudobacteroides cellulosolvens ATCC 35603 = DSM 2933]|uniref:Uncharacterized protein n=1 Tax=Pseudobacteroides cellulosolvens ATCC 35603 = DSM 2933 TaxID=398512 RepID=A0A0L6JH48_9FIRM|nr:hypothetical protein Bccel_0044 [Pseudobacteroides cellulosolvens ATCC 35603 = DSM 2933]